MQLCITNYFKVSQLHLAFYLQPHVRLPSPFLYDNEDTFVCFLTLFVQFSCLCILKRNKMKPSKGKYSKRNSFTSEHEFAFAEHLLHMHRNGEISSQNIGSHVIPEVTNMLLQRFGIPFPSNSIRSKYYALQSITRLYISFKKRGTGMGWDSTNYTFMMDDERWSQLVQV